MKYIKTYDKYKSAVNEELLGSIAKLIGNFFNKMKEKINKTKGGKEIEAIYEKYLTLINTQFEKQAKVNLNLLAAANPKVNESDEPDTKMDVDNLKKKKAILDQIITKYREMAAREMDEVLKKYGGAAKNPQLATIIEAKKSQFDLDYYNAQIAFLEKSGDKTLLPEISKKRDSMVKNIEAMYKDFDNKKAVEYKVGDNVIYLLKDKKKEEYNPNKKPEEQSNIVGVHKIAKIEGYNYTLLNKDGEETIHKTADEIFGKVNNEEVKYEVGDEVIYMLDNATKEYDKTKALKDQADVVSVHKIAKIENGKYYLYDNDNKVGNIVKEPNQIMGKTK